MALILNREEVASVLTTKGVPAPGGHYSQAIRSGGHIYVSGSDPFYPGTHKVVGKTIEPQTRQTLKNIQALVKPTELRCKR